MSICCKAIRQIYYNAGSGYTVASYMTNEDLPEEVKKQKNGNYGIFQAFGTELPTNEGLDVELLFCILCQKQKAKDICI